MELATEALAVPGAADDEARATAYAMVGWFASAGLGGLEQAEPWIQAAQELTNGIEHPGPLLRYIVEMGALLQSEHAPGQSADDLMQSLIADEDPWVRGGGSADPQPHAPGRRAGGRHPAGPRRVPLDR